MVNRRQSITLLGGATAWPLTARAQHGHRMRRIGIMLPGTESEPETQARLAAFRHALDQLGWKEGRKHQIRISLAGQQRPAHRGLLSGALRVGAGSDPHRSHAGRPRPSSGDPHHPNRVRQRRRPGRQRSHSEPRQARRQRDRIHRGGVRHHRQMAGIAQGDRALAGLLKPLAAALARGRAGGRMRLVLVLI